jgi:hypothetical protein
MIKIIILPALDRISNYFYDLFRVSEYLADNGLGRDNVFKILCQGPL